METNAHHLHKAPGRGWKHYFFEFLMLFLAVFCGFLAENMREHQVEKERGRQYISSFRDDLRTDTTNMNFQIKELADQDAVLTNMFNCFDSITGKIVSTGCLSAIILNSRGFTDFIYTDRTIQQLKYAGGLRLIQDQGVADSIIRYDAEVRELLIHQGVLETQQQIAINGHNSMISFVHLQHLGDPVVRNGPFLLTADKRELNKYFNEVYSFKQGCLTQLRRLKDLKTTATRLLIFLN